MMWTRRLWLKLQGLFGRNRNAQRLEDEIQFHLDQQIAENLAAGMGLEEARYAAMRTFGNPTVLKEETRDTWAGCGSNKWPRTFTMAFARCGRAPNSQLSLSSPWPSASVPTLQSLVW